MKILIQYLKPYKWLVFLALLLAAFNQVFSLFDPMISGWVFDDLILHPTSTKAGVHRTLREFLLGVGNSKGVAYYIGLLIGTAMVSRIAKAFQDYVVNIIIQKFGASIFTNGLQRSMQLPYQDFEDQRSGETLSILTKVRTDTEKFIGYFINVFFGIVVSVVFVTIFAFKLHWSIMPVYLGGSLLIAFVTSLLSRKIKVIQKTILAETTQLAGSTTESLRNIELVKSLGLTNEEVKRLNNNTYKILGLELRKVKSLRTLSFIQGTMVNFLRQMISLTLLIIIYGGAITAGQYMSLLFYGFFIFGPMQEIGNIILSYREAEASLNNFETLMNKSVEPKPICTV
jgi:ATP-binding cassette, subfamily B, bacterial